MHSTNMYFPLGSFRFLLATFVFINHTESVMEFFNKSVNWAGLGVWLFFVVSGFVIFSAYDLFYQGRVVRFLVNRSLRIYPTLWFCLIMSILFLYFFGGGRIYDGMTLNGYEAKEILFSFSIIGGFLSNHAWAPLSVAFTLTIEMQFYLAASVLFYISERACIQERKTMFISGTLFLLFYVFIDYSGAQNRFFGSLRFSPLFIMGAALFYLHKLNYRSFWSWVMVVTSSLYSLHLILSTGSSTEYIGFDTRAVGLTTALMFFVMIGLMLLLINRRISIVTENLDKRLGALTYPYYLIQLPIIYAMLNLYDFKGIGGVVALMIGNVVAAAIIDGLLENPLKALRNKCRGKKL